VANNNNNRNSGNNNKGKGRIKANNMSTRRGQAIRQSQFTRQNADKAVDQYDVVQSGDQQKQVKPLTSNNILRWVALGGQDDIGARNMQVLEYGDTALIIDCGFDLGLELPGVNFAIPDTTYLDQIKHKIKGYVITHGHLDHIAALPYILPKYPAPVYGSRFTIGMVEKTMDDRERGVADEYESFELETVVMNMDNHEKLKIGEFFLELVRMTHSIPGSSAAIIDTPEGRVINTGDFRLDPEPLDDKPSDIERLKEFGKDGKTLLLMSDSTNANKPGRTPTEHTLVKSYKDIITQAPGRVFVASFSSNINRIQMIIDGAVAAGRKVAIDGRSMLSTVELAARLGTIKIPKGTVTTLKSMPNIPDEQVLVIHTGGQGEMNASLQRMSIGEHKYIKLKKGDSVIVSSTPIPGNNLAYDKIGNDLADIGVKLYRAPTHVVDGCGPLHVSGHANREEQVEMYQHVKPKYFMPIYAGPLNRNYHKDNIIQNGGANAKNVIMAGNGESLEFVNGKMKPGPKIPVGTRLVDNSGAVVPSVVVKDRLVLAEDGVVTVILTIDRKSGKLLSSPDIITRGFIYMKEQGDLMDGIRGELKRAVAQRYNRVELDRFKKELKDHITHYLYDNTRRSPMVLPVVNVVNAGSGKPQPQRKPVADTSHN